MNNSSADHQQQQVVDWPAEVQHNYNNNNNNNNVDPLGLDRSYDCVFCKRGFNTAQALGGHMNIHRKNKDRPAARTARSGNDEQNTSGSSLNTYPAASPHHRGVFTNHHHNYSEYICNTPSNSHHEAVIRDDPPRYCRNFFGDDDDYGMSLGSLKLGRAAHVQQDMEKMGQLQNYPDEANLDLELRLGHD